MFRQLFVSWLPATFNKSLLNRLTGRFSPTAVLVLILMGVVESATIVRAQTRVYVTTTGSLGSSDFVSVIDAETNTVLTNIPVGLSPFDIAITPNGTRAYVANQYPSNLVSVIDIAENSVVKTIPGGQTPVGVAISPNGMRAYVTNDFANTVSVIDTVTNTVIATIPVGLEPFGVAITPDGARAYVANAGSKTVSVISTATNTVVAAIPVAPIPRWVAVTPAPQVPKDKEQCKHDGYRKFGPPVGPFKNQGQCVSYVEHHEKK